MTIYLKFFFLLVLIPHFQLLVAQNVGIGLLAPVAKLHVKGSADNSQLIIDANSTQGNINPLIRLRKSDETDLLWIHSDNPLNAFFGLNAGRVNNPVSGGTNNTFLGSSAGYSNTTSGQNIAIGSQALFSQSFNVAGPGNNVAVGF
jgi:hypothetical protein